MNTLLTDSPAEAAAYLRRGELVAFPTETVYGLGADAFDARAVEQIFVAKGRPASNPLIVHVADAGDVDRLAASVSETAERLIAHFFPGPLTVVLPKHPGVPDVVTAGLGTVGVRMPNHAMAQAFLAEAGRPVAAPSANLSGRPSPTTWEAVAADLNGRISCILRGAQSETGLESTVVDCTGTAPVLLRPGAVSLEALREIAPTIELARSGEELLARSPGTRFRHYQPNAQVHLVRVPPDTPPPHSAYIGLQPTGGGAPFELIRVCGSIETYARELFAFFREADAAGLTHIFCQTVPARGMGLALMDRLQRAAA